MKYLLIFVFYIAVLVVSKNQSRLTEALNKYVIDNGIMGMTLQISQNTTNIYKYNFGLKDYERNLPVDNYTLFRMASLSKSPTSVGLLQQIQKGKLNLQQDISQLLGFKVTNPWFPQVPITLEMVLSHQSSLIECDAYYSFLHDTYTGPPFPLIEELLSPKGNYYDTCLFNSQNKPGTYYEYTNYNFAIGATILEIVSQRRFDQYTKQHIFLAIGMNSTSYKRQDYLSHPDDISVLYRTDSKKNWVPQADNWKGNITVRNFSSYKIGTNGAVFSPQGGMYSTSSDLIKYANMLKNGGYHFPVNIISQQSCRQMLRPRYQYNGFNKALNGSEKSYNAYGLGIQTSTYRLYDRIFQHKVVRGHWGDSYGLISQLEFVDNYSFVYAINGAYNGYHDVQWSFYEKQRLQLHSAIYSYLYQ